MRAALWADREHSPLTNENWQPPGLDGLHVHRLELEYPDLYDGLQHVAKVEGPYPRASAMAVRVPGCGHRARSGGVDVRLVPCAACGRSWRPEWADAPAEVWEESSAAS